MPNTLDRITTSLGTGIPVVLLHFVIMLILLILGVLCYVAVTPFGERKLIRHGNAAAGTVMAGAIVALAIPLAATLATSTSALDTLFWGIVAVVIQLVTFGIASIILAGLRSMIEAGNIAAALALIGIQIAIALLNAGAMAG